MEHTSTDQAAQADKYDVAIAGGGVAGLTLAIQLLRTNPELRVFVCDKRSYPFPTDVHKIGEALVEGGSYYLREVIGVEDHLVKHQVVKTGLRFYLPLDGVEKIDERPEIGTDSSLPMVTYIVERSTFENHLVEVARELGATVVHECGLQSYEKQADGDFQLALEQAGGTSSVTARWFVDASGRRAIIRKQLHLTEDSMHTCASSWFRIEQRIDPHHWSERSDWLGRCPPEKRRNATNHFLGHGYWVWLIPIHDNATSVGIVIDSTIVDYAQINQLDRALDWLRANQPDIANRIAGHEQDISGFGALKNVSYTTKQMFSPERWCLTGEAACFTDPLYSTGLELIGYANTMITNMVMCDRMGQDVAPVVGFMNEIYLLLYNVLMGFYRDMYSIFGKPLVFSTKTAWDFTVYVSLPLGLFRFAKLFDPAFMQQFGPVLGKAAMLTNTMQAFFRTWATMDDKEVPRFAPCHAKLETVDRLETFYRDTKGEMSNEELLALFTENVAVLEETALEIFNRVTDRLGIKPEQPATNPYAVSLDASRWETDGLFAGNDVAIRDCVRRDVAQFWV